MSTLDTPPPASVPTTPSVLALLRKDRLLELARDASLSVKANESSADIAARIAPKLRFRQLVDQLLRDELRRACRQHGVPDHGRSRPELAARLLEAHGAADSVPPKPVFRFDAARRLEPRVGDILVARHRQWLVEGVAAKQADDEMTCLRLVCLDDDAAGDRLELLWELELGARIVEPRATGLGEVARLDAPRHFAAYLHALKWSSVTATDPRLLQSPFRAGIKLLNHQITPLLRALALPRANLFIADDVGLGKTIEAGLVLQELLLRQRVDYTLIVCPASVCLQWRDEMERRFGLRFEIYDRELVSRRRQQRGFQVNPWATHTRFIISYQTLRRPEYQEPLLAHLGKRMGKSLLILDEAHTVAPATASRYAVDSNVTRLIKKFAPKFENRLFLSATPHNGHSNSFSALLELLDPQRFTRGVPVEPRARTQVMVRRLKEDLRRVGDIQFPERLVVTIAITHESGRFRARHAVVARDGRSARTESTLDLGASTAPELTLSTLLAEYTKLAKPASQRGALVFINLQKRLLSSIAAFHRTLEAHAESVADVLPREPLLAAVGASAPSTAVDDEDDVDDETHEAVLDEVVRESSRLVTAEGRARALLQEMRELARTHRAARDAKVEALLAWMRQHQCAAAGSTDPAKASRADRRWSDARVIVFTEYGDTKTYLKRLLTHAIDGTDLCDERILEFHGGMSDEQRARVQEAWNGDPSEFPCRILLATDAAREGVNLQGHCADLFHFDIPWNPGRMEQRNGRIDRTLQPSPEVRCHYFVYTDRAEDAVLETVVEKVDLIRKELGSLGTVVLDRMNAILERGIDASTRADVDRASHRASLADKASVVNAECEAERPDEKRIRVEIDEAGKVLERSRGVMDFHAELLRDALDVGFELAGASTGLTPVPKASAFALPALPASWQPTLDTLRPTRDKATPFFQWRQAPLPPVVFDPPSTISDKRVHLHLSHPLVKRVLGRFLAQGFGAHDLSRVTVIRDPESSVARVVAFGRLSLFGPGATRLHDELIAVSAPWFESKSEGHLKPFADDADRRAVARLDALLRESPTLDGIRESVREKLRASATDDFGVLWRAITEDADDKARAAESRLKQRGHEEATQLRALLEAQRAAIDTELSARAQLRLSLDFTDPDQRRQWEEDVRSMESRRTRIASETETESTAIQALYEVSLRRLLPVGLVYLWPETRG